jgi:hypothetical protein
MPSCGELVDRLVDLPHARLQFVVVRRGHGQELDAAITERRHRRDDVVGGQRDVLHARADIEVEVLLDLRLLLARRRLVDRELDA